MFKITKENCLNILYMIGVIFSIVFAIPLFIISCIFLLSIPFFLTFPSIGKSLYTLSENITLWFKSIFNYPVGPESTPIGGWIIVFLVFVLTCMYILEHSVNGRGVPHSR